MERWFAELTNQRIRRGSFVSVEELIATSEDFLATWNENPKPLVWTATVSASSPNSLDAAKPWNRSSPAAPLQKAENVCPVNSWTLH